MSRDPVLAAFLAGAISVAFAIISLFFLRFWRRTSDPLFLSFAAAFLLLAAGQTVLALANVPDENLSSVYLFRLGAFLLIIWAVLSKNFRSR